MQQTVTPASLRNLIEAVFLSDADLDAFCFDCHRSVHKRFTNGMNRIAKQNILLERVLHSTLLLNLEQHPIYSSRYQQHKHLLKSRSILKDRIGHIFILVRSLVHGQALTPTIASVRELFNSVIIDDSDLEAFCINYFPSIKKRFSTGMDRIAKLNLLFEQEKADEILLALRDDDGSHDSVRSNEHLLRYRLVDRNYAIIILVIAVALLLLSIKQCAEISAARPRTGTTRVSSQPDMRAPHDLGIVRDLKPVAASEPVVPVLKTVSPIGAPLKERLCHLIKEQIRVEAKKEDEFANAYQSISEGDIRGWYRLTLLALGKNVRYEFAVTIREIFTKTVQPMIGLKPAGSDAFANIPALTQWAEYYLADQPSAENEKCMHEIYNDTAVKNFSRIFIRSFLILHKYKILDELPEDLDHSSEYTICRSSDFVSIERKRWGITTRPYRGNSDDFPDLACLFWLRRYADGSGASLARLAAKLARRYDPDFWKQHSAEFPAEL